MAKMKLDELPCPKCAEPIKAAASRCKHCGYDLTPEEVESRKKTTSGNAQSVGIGCGVLILGALALAMCASGEDDDAEDPAKTAADRQAGFHCLSAWDGSHRDFADKVKEQLRDPESFEHDETRVTPNKDGRHTIIMKYRARNGFGGMNVGTAIGSFDHDSCVASDPIIG